MLTVKSSQSLEVRIPMEGEAGRRNSWEIIKMIVFVRMSDCVM